MNSNIPMQPSSVAVTAWFRSCEPAIAPTESVPTILYAAFGSVSSVASPSASLPKVSSACLTVARPAFDLSLLSGQLTLGCRPPRYSQASGILISTSSGLFVEL